MKAIPSASGREVTLPNGEVITVDLCGECEEAPVWAMGRCLKCYARAYAQENPDKVREYSRRRYRRFQVAREAIEKQLAALRDDAAATETYVLEHPDEREALQAFFAENWEATLADYLAQSRDCDTCKHYKHQGANVVPYGDTSVVESEVYECELGYHPGDCDLVKDYEKGGE